jgi:hypothetical protein
VTIGNLDHGGAQRAQRARRTRPLLQASDIRDTPEMDRAAIIAALRDALTTLDAADDAVALAAARLEAATSSRSLTQADLYELVVALASMDAHLLVEATLLNPCGNPLRESATARVCLTVRAVASSSAASHTQPAG